MQAKHTQGPWEVDGNIAVRSSGPDGRQVCLCEITVRGRDHSETYDEAAANARIIAAAPELLDALKDMVLGIDAEFGPSRTDVNFPKARAAISKAESNPA